MGQLVLFALWIVAKLVLVCSRPSPSILDNYHMIWFQGIQIRHQILQHPLLAVCTNDGYLRNVTKLYKHVTSSNRGFAPALLLMLSGDVAINPGPAKCNLRDFFPCGICDLRVDWSDVAVECDECRIWYHRSCISMSSRTYSGIERNDNTWNCFHCHSTNNSSLLYQAYNISIANRFETIGGIPGDDSVFLHTVHEPGSPLSFAPPAHSSPASHQTSIPALQSSIRSSTSTSSSNRVTSSTRDIQPDHNNLRIVVANVNSIRGKKAEVAHLCSSVQPDIILISESKLDSSISHTEFLPSHYTGHIRQDRTKNAGGVMIVHKDNLVIDQVDIVNGEHHDQVVWARLSVRNSSPIYIGSYYRSNSCNSQDTITALSSSLEHISSITRNNPRATVILGGDFNAKDIDWNNYTVKPAALHAPLCEAVLATIQDHNLEQLQRSPTRQKSLLDLYCTSKPNLVKSISTIPGFTPEDHDFIVVDNWVCVERLKKTPRKFYKWSKADWASIKAKTIDFASSFLADNANSVQDNYDAFAAHLQDMLDQHIPHGFTKSRWDVPWLNPQLKRRCARKRRMFNRARKSGQDQHWEQYKAFASDLKKQLRQAHWRHINNILLEAENNDNPKPFWNYIKSQSQDNVGVAPLKHQGRLFSSAQDRAKILSQQFKSVFTRDHDSADRHTAPLGPNYPPMAPFTITEEGVLKLLKAINPTKASGPDCIPCRLLKELAEEIAAALTFIFRQSLHTGQVPLQWKEQWITPIYKKGAKGEAANYRPVSLTCVTSKLLEHIICTQIRAHLDTYGILSIFQHGFRAKHSCETQLAITMHDIMRLNDHSTQVDIAILDFSKAFDVVPHDRLLNKLKFYGVSAEVHHWIRNFLSGRSQRVIVDGAKSEEESVDSGVPQGTVLGPLLFLLFINDIESNLNTGTSIRLFADDCLLYRPIHTIRDQVLLQQDLASLQAWSITWGMKFNPTKCNILRTRSGLRGTMNYFYELHNVILEEVSTAKYLGVWISNDLSWTHHVDYVAKKGNQKLGFLRRNLRGAPLASRRLAYTSLVRSGLEYAAPIWDPHKLKDRVKLEKIQRKAARWVKSSYSPHTSVTAILQDLGWSELEERRRVLRLALLYNIYFEKMSILQQVVRLARTGLSAVSSLHQITPTAPTTRLFSAFTSHGKFLSCTLPQVDATRAVTYNPYPTFETNSPYKNNGPYRYGYKLKIWRGGLLPRPDPKNEKIRALPRKPYTYNKADAWTEKKALFGQNDYIDILGDGDVKPADTITGVPLWLKGWKGNELQRNIRKLTFQGRYLKDMKPDRYHSIRKNIFYLYKKMNRRKKAPYFGGRSTGRCRIYKLKI